MSAEDTISGLREAVKLSPDNLPLRLHLAETLMTLGQADAAEKEFRTALSQWPDNVKLKSGLAHAFFQQGKKSEAMVVCEELVKGSDTPSRTRVLYARLLAAAGDVDRAVRQYKKAIEDDPSAADLEFAGRLGIQTQSGIASDEEYEARQDVIDGKVRASFEGAGAPPSDDAVEKPKIGFDDVGGMDGVKDEIRMKIIHPLTHADLYKAYGKPIGGGILMYGPPGCGKTHLARATAGEIKAAFIAVGINDVLDMWIGNSERNLHALFEQGRRNRPCVLFFDEVDALAASRSDMKHSGARHIINQFLSELDGVQASNDGVLILAATNAPWHVDSAFRRPGRFDRILFVPPPDAAARAGILRILCKGKPQEAIDFDHVAKKTDAFSGADLKAVVDVAIEAKLREAMKSGTPKPMTTKDMIAAAATIRPSTKEWFATARNYALYSNQGGVYDDILKYLKL